ncbi:hypothetical protein MAPG_00387 [Magnaporthiopsis poae ATCC 64411]|uniref:Uncharacterized protein n=1 Tax=Magnaporthiopsis poae (strain ATCC 64411 / 73-15) TaxID=644358 RepID=A0A0C4DKV5_MAGP6|nr:hypothetical protein MAPG_00387 [Magnaporthiopsis poae ATCC 64411]
MSERIEGGCRRWVVGRKKKKRNAEERRGVKNQGKEKMPTHFFQLLHDSQIDTALLEVDGRGFEHIVDDLLIHGANVIVRHVGRRGCGVCMFLFCLAARAWSIFSALLQADPLPFFSPEQRPRSFFCFFFCFFSGFVLFFFFSQMSIDSSGPRKGKKEKISDFCPP